MIVVAILISSGSVYIVFSPKIWFKKFCSLAWLHCIYAHAHVGGAKVIRSHVRAQKVKA